MIDIEKVIELILDGKTYRQIAFEFDTPLSTLHDFCSKSEHSARVREALEFSGNTYADKAEQVLLDAAKDPIEMQRARELAQHYRWKASKRTPKVYGDRVDIDHTTKGEKVIGEIDYSKLSDEVLQQIINAKKE